MSNGGGGRVRAEAVVLVADDSAAAELARAAMEDDLGLHVETDGRAALEASRRLRPAVIVLGVELPEVDGTEVYRQLRDAGDATPVVFVAAGDDEIDKVSGLEPGTYDYVSQPFRPRELLARLQSVLRSAAPVFAVGAVRLDPSRRRVWAGDEEVALTATEFELLAHLMERPGRVYPRERLLAEVWGYAQAAGTRTVDVHVAQLRAKLGPHSPIRTVRGVGYAADAS
jgi:DNA-binding response OmpR family regulator